MKPVSLFLCNTLSLCCSQLRVNVDSCVAFAIYFDVCLSCGKGGGDGGYCQL